MKLPLPEPMKDLLLLLAMFAVFEPILPTSLEEQNNSASVNGAQSSIIEIVANEPLEKTNDNSGSEGKQSSLSLLIDEQGQLIYNNTVLDQAQIQALAEKEATYTVSIALPMPTKQLRELSEQGFNIELQ